MNYFIEAITKKYANFSGRARRKEYWLYMLFYFILYTIFATLSLTTNSSIFSALFGIIMLALVIPTLAVLIRRLHDLNKSGWWYFISVIPFIGSIWLLVLLCTEGTVGTNTYGANSKDL